ncbi:drebrin isoform X2 [Narcine bancroftii]|uniref:drebrin isoform X2 n=1 Tax=Narcine bancroftii TaxID=1343680 RepID=UPI003830FFCB
MGAGTMALNLSNHRLALLTAYEDVINEKTSTDWALYTYEDQTDNLKLADSGAGGLQEIATKFDNQSVMYGFCSIKDSGSGLPKYVLINWVGEDVDDHRKCTCASHVPTIADFFQYSLKENIETNEVKKNCREVMDNIRINEELVLAILKKIKVDKSPGPDKIFPRILKKGANVIVNASSPEDVDSTAIRQKLTNGTMHVPSPVLRRLHLKEEDDLLGPVGTTYQKTNAAIEMKRINRELFWAQAKREEELRKEEERKKVIEEREKFERERMEQEKKEQEDREQRYREREKQIEEERKKLQSLDDNEIKDALIQNNNREGHQEGMDKDEENRGSKISDSAEKAAEAAALIALRDGNPREFFKQRERAMTTSFESVHFSGQRPGRVNSPFLKNQNSPPERSWSPPRSPCPRIAANHSPFQSFPAYHPIQYESTRLEDVTSFSSPDPSIVAAPIYEENEEGAEEQFPNLILDGEKPPIRCEELLPTQNVSNYTDKPSLVEMDTPIPVWPEAPSFVHTEESVHIELGSFTSTEEQSLMNIGKLQTHDNFPQVNDNLLDLLEANGIDQVPSESYSEIAEKPLMYTTTDEMELIFNMKRHQLDETHADTDANSQRLVNFRESTGQCPELEPTELGPQQQAQDNGGKEEDNLLCFEGLPAPPPDCLDAQQWENIPSLIELTGSQQMSEDFCFGMQELPKPQDAEAVEDFFNRPQDECIKFQSHVEEPSSKIPVTCAGKPKQDTQELRNTRAQVSVVASTIGTALGHRVNLLL